MKILVIGLGSMGKRRIRLLNKYNSQIDVIGIDTRGDRRAEVEDLFRIKTYSSLNSAIEDEHPIAALVCSSPITHGDIILECLRNNLHVFTEINLLSDQYTEILEEAKKKNLMVFLSSTLLYRNEIKYIKSKILKEENKLHYRYHVGQYLPDWHPWEHFNEFFVVDKRTNGCREIFAIELPWIIKTFGKVKDIHVVRDKISTLNLDYPDAYIVVVEHESGNKGVINVDLVSRKAIRSFEVYSEKLHLFWEGTPNSLQEYDCDTKETKRINTYSTVESDTNYADNIIENAYLEELKTFIMKLNGNDIKPRYTMEDDYYTLKLIDQIEGI